MHRIPITFHNRLMKGEVPIGYIAINTHMGYRVYAEKELVEVFELNPYIADGTYTADGSVTAGGDTLGIIDKAARVLSFGTFERTLQPLKSNVLGSYQSKTLQKMTVTLENSDRYFSQLIASEPFVSRELKYWVGFESDPQSEHISLFRGIITEMNVLPKMTIYAEER